jgi:hypothetical protein
VPAVRVGTPLAAAGDKASITPNVVQCRTNAPHLVARSIVAAAAHGSCRHDLDATVVAAAEEVGAKFSGFISGFLVSVPLLPEAVAAATDATIEAPVE